MMEVDEELSNEDYLISRAKTALSSDPFEAKAWMLSAQALFPHKFSVRFEAYQIEKSTKNLKEAAKSFASLFSSFPEEKELFEEVQKMMLAVRRFEEAAGQQENRQQLIDSADYCVQLFFQLPGAVQHAMLLACAEKTPDAMEHCRLMLTLFNKFPGAVGQFGPQLMENLITAEKHSKFNQTPVNSYRRLLVCELMPLLGNSNVELSAKNLYRLLHKAIEFYLVYLFGKFDKSRVVVDEESPFIEDPWAKLWKIFYIFGGKLSWELSRTFAGYWNKENYWKIILSFYKSRSDESGQMQVAFCMALVLFRCVHEYLTLLANDDESGFVLVEAFRSDINSSVLNQPMSAEEDLSRPLMTAADGSCNTPLIQAFTVADRCWDLLHRSEFLQREFNKLSTYLRCENWLRVFRRDSSFYEGKYEKTLMLIKADDPTSLSSELITLSCYFATSNMAAIVDSLVRIALILNMIPSNSSVHSNLLTIETRHSRHLHYLPRTKASALQYCVQVLITALKHRKSDMALGHKLVLMQYNWPSDRELLQEIADIIERRGGFTYPIFTNYVINEDILEQFAYLSSDNGPKVPLDILPNSQLHSQRRMSTRGGDRGAKEDFRQAIRGQVARSNEHIDQIVINFFMNEQSKIHHSLITN